jgi:hypothetical protein
VTSSGHGGVTFTCCRHCVPDHPAHPERDQHDKPCGPAWCSESVPTSPQLDLFTEATA